MKKVAVESIVEFQIPAARHEERVENRTAAPLGAKPSLPGVVIGRLVGFEDGQPRVDFPENPQAAGITAYTGVPLSLGKIGREVILAFADGDPAKPVILGLLVDAEKDHTAPSSPLDIQIDGERLVVTAQREIVLHCGEASITLTAAGKIIIKGTYVLSRSAGYNKIKGAAVDIN